MPPAPKRGSDMKVYGVPGGGSAIVEAMLALVGESYDLVDV
ncbi:hypothetical protein [Sphingomonas sp. Leaf10]|nr:hypothetical protein [Sphingomonas sp. Leaf10]